MRLLFVLVAGAIGWLWFAARAPAEAPPPPPAQARRADLTGLTAQVTAARSAVIPELPELEPVPEPEPEAEIEVEEDVPPSDAIDLSNQAGEIILVEGHAPIITMTDTSCGPRLDVEYTKHIPLPGRTFESVLGTPNPGHTFENVDGAAIIDGEVVTISSGERTFGLADGEVLHLSSGPHLGNTYYVNEDEPAIDQPAVDQPFLDETEVTRGGY